MKIYGKSPAKRPAARRLGIVVLGALAALALLPAAARAQPPANDNRAQAQVIATFPATIAGTTVEATVERLDPQVSDCGRVEGTVWYRINTAPDGTIGLTARGAGLSPVVRVYGLEASHIEEIECAAAGAGRPAQVSFEATRGASYLVLVGMRSGTPAKPFTLEAKLFLPPANDAVREAHPLRSLPAHVTGTTIAATSNDSDPEGCRLGGNTVWYSLRPRAGQRIVLKLHAEGTLDASAIVLQRVRSETDQVACGATSPKGDVVLVWDTVPDATYLIAVGTRENSKPGTFTLDVRAVQGRETAPGVRLPQAGVRSTVEWQSDPNDVYWSMLSAGKTYRIAFSSACARLVVRNPLGHTLSFGCSGYTTLTPGPDGGGRYVFEVTAPNRSGTVGYRLLALAAGRDDIGVGIPLANLQTVRGRLAPDRGDAVDLYHFVITDEVGDVRVRLGTASRDSISMSVLTDSGDRIASSNKQSTMSLERGRYVIAIRGTPGTPGGRYAVWLVIRTPTITTIAFDSTELTMGSTVTPVVTVIPGPDMGWVTLQVDRLDPLEGWVFHRTIRVKATGGRIPWTPPFAGRWRIRASYLGSLRFSASRSEYVQLNVTDPAR
jgi:hypothetical protein